MNDRSIARAASLTVVGLLPAVGLLFSAPLVAQYQDRCEFRQDIELSLPADGIQLLDITAKAGSLNVVGTSGISTVQVEAIICTSDEERAQGLAVTLEQSGSRAVLETIFPRNREWRNGYARIDVVVRMPIGLDARIVDGSGHTKVAGTGALNINDGSGHLELRDIGGDLNIEDGSGHIEVHDVAGRVHVDDGSGSITIVGVDGSVTLDDGSGNVEIQEVTRDVTVTDKGSGRIDVQDVQGDLSVSGTRRERIQYDNVAGTLDLPAPRRRGRGGN